MRIVRKGELDGSTIMVVGLLLLVVVSCIACGGFFGIDKTYSEGYRVGQVQKFGKKGAIFQSWEGELVLPMVKFDQGSAGNIWHFSVDDAAVVETINNIQADQTVKLHYRQVLCNASHYHGTSYRITKVEVLQHKQP